MNRTLLVCALFAFALTACGREEQAAAPAASTPAPVAAPAAATPAAPATPEQKSVDEKPEQKN